MCVHTYTHIHVLALDIVSNAQHMYTAVIAPGVSPGGLPRPPPIALSAGVFSGGVNSGAFGVQQMGTTTHMPVRV